MAAVYTWLSRCPIHKRVTYSGMASKNRVRKAIKEGRTGAGFKPALSLFDGIECEAVSRGYLSPAGSGDGPL